MRPCARYVVAMAHGKLGEQTDSLALRSEHAHSPAAAHTATSRPGHNIDRTLTNDPASPCAKRKYREGRCGPAVRSTTGLCGPVEGLLVVPLWERRGHRRCSHRGWPLGVAQTAGGSKTRTGVLASRGLRSGRSSNSSARPARCASNEILKAADARMGNEHDLRPPSERRYSPPACCPRLSHILPTGPKETGREEIRRVSGSTPGRLRRQAVPGSRAERCSTSVRAACAVS